MPKKPPNRTLIHVTWRKKESMWFVVITQRYFSPTNSLTVYSEEEAQQMGLSFKKKSEGVKVAVLSAKLNLPASVYIHRRRSQIIDERSFGTDPRKTKG